MTDDDPYTMVDGMLEKTARRGRRRHHTRLYRPHITCIAQLYVQVCPEVALSRQGESTLILKIRLAPGARATLWNAKACNAPYPETYVVGRSGIYSIPLSVIPGPPNAGTCLATSDGAFAVFLPSNTVGQVILPAAGF